MIIVRFVTQLELKTMQGTLEVPVVVLVAVSVTLGVAD